MYVGGWLIIRGRTLISPSRRQVANAKKGLSGNFNTGQYESGCWSHDFDKTASF